MQPNITENPDDVMRRFLPEMRMTLNIEDLLLYLLSENAIGDDDAPKLTVSGHLSKAQVIMNLQQIITTRGTIEQFLLALKRSSEDHTGHKELYNLMLVERQRRMSVSSQRSSTSRSMSLRVNSITSQSPLIPESSSQTNPLSSEPPPTVVVAESGVSMLQANAPPSNNSEEAAPNVSQPHTNPDKPRSNSNTVAADVCQQPDRRSEFIITASDLMLTSYMHIIGFWIGWLFGGKFYKPNIMCHV